MNYRQNIWKETNTRRMLKLVLSGMWQNMEKKDYVSPVSSIVDT